MGSRVSNSKPSEDGDADAFLRGLASIDWTSARTSLDAMGYTVLPKVLSPGQCRGLSAQYESAAAFRSRILMARFGFGQGEYQYFAYPLPPVVQVLRTVAYAPLAGLANVWAERLGGQTLFPDNLEAYLEACHCAGQCRPTPLLLKYKEGDYNRLHQDLYGALVFPFQLTVLLSMPDEDFTGGEFVLTELRPRMQSRAEVVPLTQGDAVVFTVNERPVQGARGFYRAKMRHGVSTVRSGNRYTLGVIFHDAK